MLKIIAREEFSNKAPMQNTLFFNIQELWRQRQCLHRAEKALTLQIKSICRRLNEGDKVKANELYKTLKVNGGSAPEAMLFCGPFFSARHSLEQERKVTEKQLTSLVQETPAYDWVSSVRGVSNISVASVVGEAGDLSNYATISRLYKRMGLAVFDEKAQRRVAGQEGIRQGYCPRRRSVVWNIGACMIKCGSPYKSVYDSRKIYETPRVETKMHAHRRAQRYMEKRFLFDYWNKWNEQSMGLNNG